MTVPTPQTTRQRLYEHSLRVILDNQQPGGAFLACPNMPDYQFSWFRDGAFIAYALTLDGKHVSAVHGGSDSAQWENTFRFHDWCAGIINARTDALERCITRAGTDQPQDPDDLLNSRYRPDGSAGPADWPEFQLDGPGTWLWSLAQFVDAWGMSPLPAAWDRAVRLTARYLAALWQTPCHDCWEERGDAIHVSTLAAIYAGLQAANALLKDVDYSDICAAIKQYVHQHGITPGGELAKSVGLDMVDANLMGVALPHGLFDIHDGIVKRTIERIERELHPDGSGVHRHLDDTYYGGGAWVLLALWLAWHYAESGDRERALALLEWSEAQADADGNLPEQVDSIMLSPGHYYQHWLDKRGPIANPLLWTHAKYILVLRKLDLLPVG